MYLCESIWVFLAARRFAAKTPVKAYWICLDFLGFSRQNLDFSMGYTGSGEKFFFRAPFAFGSGSAAEAPAVEAMRKGGIIHGASLIIFLIYGKQLSFWLAFRPRQIQRPLWAVETGPTA